MVSPAACGEGRVVKLGVQVELVDEGGPERRLVVAVFEKELSHENHVVALMEGFEPRPPRGGGQRHRVLPFVEHCTWGAEVCGCVVTVVVCVYLCPYC